jgi:histone acetyltransferase (RNA polymerase elongator complex component)
MNLRLQNPLYKNIFDFYQVIHPSIRINRVFRDIPVNIIRGGTKQASIRSEMDNDLDTLGALSNCIRYREVGNSRNLERDHSIKPTLKKIKFESSKGIEYFITFMTDEERPLLYSILRLRLSSNSGRTPTGRIIFPELVDCAIIREVHTYGKAVPCKENQKYYNDNPLLFSQDEDTRPQHKGFGKQLLKEAERISIKKGYKKID